MKKLVFILLILFCDISFSQTVSWKAEVFGTIDTSHYVGPIICSEDDTVFFLYIGYLNFANNSGPTNGIYSFDLFYRFDAASVCPDGNIAAAGICLNTQTYTVALINKMSQIKYVTNGLPYSGPIINDTVNTIKTFSSDENNNIYAATSNKVFFLAKGDSTWKQRSTGLPLNLNIFSSIVIDTNTIVIGTLGKGIYYSKDKGLSWIKTNSSTTDGINIYTFAKNSSGDIFASSSSGIFRSKDKGHTWLSVSKGLNSLYIRSLAINKHDRIFALAHTGSNNKGWELYNSIDNGENWSLVVNQPPISSSFGYMGINSEGYIFISGHSCLYFSSMPTTNAEYKNGISSKVSYSLDQNFPNPFNPSTTICYSQPVQSHVELKVFDMLGREVSVLVNREQPPGEYKVQFDGSSLPSGVYIYALQAGGFRESKKLLLLK